MGSGMVIIGAGECGGRAAFALREHGYEGPVTLIGEEQHHPYERPPLSKDALTMAVAGAEMDRRARSLPGKAHRLPRRQASWRSTARPRRKSLGRHVSRL